MGPTSVFAARPLNVSQAVAAIACIGLEYTDDRKSGLVSEELAMEVTPSGSEERILRNRSASKGEAGRLGGGLEVPETGRLKGDGEADRTPVLKDDGFVSGAFEVETADNGRTTVFADNGVPAVAV